MKRYYLSPIKQYNDPQLGNYWGHHFQQAYPGVEYEAGEILVDPVTGLPTEKALLILVGAINHRDYVADPDLVDLPNVNHDMKVSAIHSGTKVAAKAKAKNAAGYSDAEINEIWNNADGMRDILNAYGRKNNPNFDVNNFDLNDG